MMSTLAARLAAPSRVLSLEELAREWTAARVTVRIGGYGVLAHDLVLLRRVRGGLGRVLMRSASAEALAGRPCPWDPPCGLDVLFREQGRTGPDGIPKPFVLGASRLGPDLIVTLTLFGLAIDWVPAVASALVDTLKNGIDWRGQREGLYLPEPAVSDVWVRGVPGPVVPPVAVAARLTFLTPMNSEGDDPRERPATIVARLARRAEGLARWHDAAIGEDWRALGEVWASLDYDAGGLHAGRVDRHAGRANRNFDVATVGGVMIVAGLPPPLQALLAIGESMHVGKGAAEGFGRYRLDWVPARGAV